MIEPRKRKKDKTTTLHNKLLKAIFGKIEVAIHGKQNLMKLNYQNKTLLQMTWKWIRRRDSRSAVPSEKSQKMSKLMEMNLTMDPSFRVNEGSTHRREHRQ